MTQRPRFADLRRHHASRLTAVFFVVLILLPFTAPFPTFQLNGSSQDLPFDTTPKDFKTKVVNDAVGLPVEWCGISFQAHRTKLTRATLTFTTAAPANHHSVLRI